MDKHLPSKIFLVGFMGAGKTTLGKKLAKKLNYHFIDTDTLIETSQNQDINKIFEEKGEDAFRKIESDTLKEVIQLEQKCIVSTGGGVPCFNQNMQLILKNGTAIWLKLDEKSIVKRLVNAKQKRPLIQGLTENEIAKKISQLLNKRISFYQQSPLQINAINLKNINLDCLIKKLKELPYKPHSH